VSSVEARLVLFEFDAGNTRMRRLERETAAEHLPVSILLFGLFS
jgi:hypothetical protein